MSVLASASCLRAAPAPCRKACREESLLASRSTVVGADVRSSTGPPGSSAFASPKSSSFTPELRQHHVARLQVPVHDPCRCAAVQRIRNLDRRTGATCSRRQRPLLQTSRECLALEKLHHQVLGLVLRFRRRRAHRCAGVRSVRSSSLPSRSARAHRADEDRCRGRTLIATPRSSRVSRARYTSPIPPAPSGERISYGPRRVPGASATAQVLPLARSISALRGTAPMAKTGSGRAKLLSCDGSRDQRLLRGSFREKVDHSNLNRRPDRTLVDWAGSCEALENAHATIRRGRSGPGSSPWSTRPRSPARTSPSRRRLHRPRRGPAAASSSRRRDRRACRST